MGFPIGTQCERTRSSTDPLLRNTCGVGVYALIKFGQSVSFSTRKASPCGGVGLAPHSKRAPRHAATVSHKAITRHVYMFEVSPDVSSGKGTKERNQAIIFLVRGKVDKALGNPYVCPVEQGSSQDLAL